MQGTPFGRFQLLDVRGAKPGADVWRAYDEATGHVVAVKVLPARSSANDAFMNRLHREARVAAELNHPHVVGVLEAGEADGRPYLVTPLAEGGDLRALLADGPLPPERTARIVEQVASALDAAHGAGLVHGGVKPSNVLIGADGVARLADFGGAHGTDVTNAETVDTWAHVAPETILTGAADRRADVYSLAAVLHFYLTGYQPFPGDGAEVQIAAHLTAPLPRPTASNAELPAALDDVVAVGMAKEPGQRYVSAGALAAAARAAVGPTQSAADPTPPAPPAPPVVEPLTQPPAAPRPLLYAGIAAAVVVALVVAGVVLFTGGSESSPATGTFDGFYRAEFGPATTLDGTTPTSIYFAPISTALAVRSACPESGCVAIARTVGEPLSDDAGAGRPSVTDEFVFDELDGTWVSVTVTPKAGEEDQWRVLSLRPGPGGTLVGDYRYLRSDRSGAMRAVTFTRTGDVSADQEPDDPASLAPRPDIPAMALRGRYTYSRTLVNITAGETDEPTDTIEGLDAFTNCLRDGERCFSALSNEDSIVFLSGADGAWTYAGDANVRCGRRDIAAEVSTFEMPIPTNTSDPVPLLEGRGHLEQTGDCELSADIEVRFERTGDAKG